MNRYTAIQIATPLGRTRQAVYSALGDVPAVQTDPVRAWQLQDLPAPMLAEIDAIVRRRNYRTREQLLDDPPRRWQPSKPFAELPEPFQHEAEQWRDALALPLARQHALPAAELSALSLAECRRVFGREPSDKTWRAHFDLAVKRDNGFEQWQRVDLFVAEAAYAAGSSSTAVAVEFRGLHRQLGDVIAQLENKSRPTLDDRAFLLDAAFRHLETLCEAHAERRRPKEIKRSLVGYLHSALPALARTEAALRRLFDRKLTAWRVGGRAVSSLTDLRNLNSGRKGAKLCPDCRKKSFDKASSLDGNESQAWRRLHQSGELCPVCATAWKFNARRNKSYVPATVRRDITPDVDKAVDQRRGPDYVRKNGAYIPRDWSDTGPGDWFSADDVTWNNFYWFTDDAGEKQITRGECLLKTDLRTGYPLGFLMIAGKYNSQHVRTLMLRVHDLETTFHGETVKAGGLPHLGVFYENGVWAARLVEGPRRRGCEWNPWRETERGLREHGLNLEVRHAAPQNARAKPIECLLRIIQERHRIEPGFVGFGERRDEREVMQDFLARVRKGKEHPGNELLSMEQWGKRIGEILQEFADDPQNGKMLPGVSPAEAWWNGIGGKPGIADKPLRRLPDAARFLLATHKRVVNVTPKGIRFDIGKREFVFWGESLAPHVNRRLLGFFNLECPELLVCSDMNRQNYFAVKAVSAPAMTASRECLTDLNRQRAAFMRPAKTLFGSLPKPLASTITRDTEADEATRKLGSFVAGVTLGHEIHQREVQSETRKVRQLAATMGNTIPNTPRNVRRVKEGLDLEAEALAEINAMENQT